MLARGSVGGWYDQLCEWRDPIFTDEGNKQQSHFWFHFLNFSSFLSLDSAELPTLCNAVSLNHTDIWCASKLQPREILSYS